MRLSLFLPTVHALPIAVASLTAIAGCASIPPGRSAIDSVRIVGARDVDRGEIVDKLATAESPKFLGLFRGIVFDYEIFDPSVLQRDLARVERTYRGRGFLEAHARAARVVHTSSDHVRVEIVVDEGPPTLNRQVLVRGLEDLPPEIAAAVQAAANEALPVGVRFDEESYKKAQTAVTRALTDRGYAYATEQADAQVDLPTRAIDYTFTVVPGPLAVFGAITIVGLDPDGRGPVQPEIEEGPLLRAMNIAAGDPYSTATIDAASQALLDLEVLSAVQIVPQLPNPPARVVPLLVKVEPGKLRELRLGGGFELDQIKTEVHGLVGWEDHDFLGNLRDLSIDLKPGLVLYPTRIDNLVAPNKPLFEERLRLQFRQPGFLEPRTTLFVQPEFNVYPLLVPQAGPQPPEPIVVGYVEPKGTVGVERRFGQHFLVRLAQNVQGEIPIPYVSEPAEALPSMLLSYPQLVTTLDYRDDQIHTHKGFYLSNDLQTAFAGTAEDVRIAPEVRGYVPVTRNVTFAARAQLGFLFAQNYGGYVRSDLSDTSYSAQQQDADIQIMYFRGFFSGGPSSNRGFPLRGIAPHGTIPFLNPATSSTQFALGCAPPNGLPASLVGSAAAHNLACALPIGGFSQWEASAELRIALAGPLGTALFCDAGDVSARQLDIRPTHLHLSCGAGVRYDTPLGPIRLDVGYRIQPLQVLGYKDEGAVRTAFPTEGIQPRLFGQSGVIDSGVPIGISFGILESF
jgi:outer membrane protein insertion porin family/translocation and assembly module TamA